MFICGCSCFSLIVEFSTDEESRSFERGGRRVFLNREDACAMGWACCLIGALMGVDVAMLSVICCWIFNANEIRCSFVFRSRMVFK